MVYKKLGWGITQIETGFYRDDMAACYLLEQDGQVAIIETGIKSTVNRILTLLREKNIPLEQVSYVIPTHVHLDHAGGAGLLMQTLPNAKLVIHPLGARHMIDPSKLQAGAIAVYGEAVFNATYGDLIPIKETDIIEADDGFSLMLGSRELTFYDTPGHARHHFCVYDSLSNGLFTGDTFGLAYQELQHQNTPFIFPTSSPVQFDPQAMKSSIRRLMALQPSTLFLTHFGMVEATEYLAQEMIELIDAYVEISTKHTNSDNRITAITEELMAYLIARKQAQGFMFDEDFARQVLLSDINLNAKGLDVWLKRK